MRVVDLENVDFADDIFLPAPVRHVVEEVEAAVSQPRTREVRRHCLPGGTEPGVAFEEILILVKIRREVRRLDPRVSRPGQAVFSFQKLEQIVRIAHVVNIAQLRVDLDERLARRSFHRPEDRFRE